MDYTKVPRSLIFKDRTNLNDFGVQDEGTINNYLFTQMRKLTLLRCGNAKEIALQCFNNAYYICTLIQLDELPDLSMDKYEYELMKVKIPFQDDVYQASMALVCVLLAAYDNKYKQKDDLLIESICHWTSSNKWTFSESHKSFEDIIRTCNTDSFVLHKSDFAPRNIIEVIETISDRYLQDYTEYICERLFHVEDPRLRMHGADTAIARIKDYQRTLIENCKYNPKKDSFNSEGIDYPLRDFTREENVRNNYQKSKEAIEYYTEHYPKENSIHPEQQTDSAPTIPRNKELITENEQLRQKLTKLDSKIHELVKENDKLKKQLEELTEPVEELTAEQKVQMAFTFQLLKVAGLTDEILKKRGNKAKVATIMSLLTGISSNNSRGNKAQICQTFLSDSGKYYPRKQNLETLIRLNTLCVELGINASLNLESQSNK